MKNTENNFNKLLNEYAELKDKLIEYTFNGNLHDSMYWDLEGYYSESDDHTELFDDLYNQVKACRNLLKGYKQLHYIFC
jgi:hypothetical protein